MNIRNDIIREILEIVKQNSIISSRKIFENLSNAVGYSTVKRMISNLVEEKFLSVQGNGKSSKYFLSSNFELLYPIDINEYFTKEIDEREIKSDFNFELIRELLWNNEIFSNKELDKLNLLQNKFRKNTSQLSEIEYQKEFERLAIDLSWKSSQIEGNTYSLLETEILLKEKKTASGKTKEEAVMLLNHKDAIDFIMENPDYIFPLTVSKIEDIHSILVKELNISRNIRTKRVGISGTNYRPLENEFHIKEALIDMCDLVNFKSNIFEKALLTLVLISYIQPFIDGNKRTARITSNSILINNNYCPISFRTVDSIDYKKAMIIFYEQHNISSFKEIFIEQFEFAVNTYF